MNTMDYPPVAVLVVTYNRVSILQETLVRLLEHLSYPGRVLLYVADDGSDDGTQDMIARDYNGAVLVQSHRQGLGGNANAGLRAIFDAGYGYVLQLQDDLHLLAPLDLTQHIRFFQERENVGMIRLQGLTGHHWTATMEPRDQPSMAGFYWRVHWDCREVYVAGDHVHLKRKWFHDYFGYYPERQRTDHTEERWCVDTKRHAIAGEERGEAVPQVYLCANWDTENNWRHAGIARWREVGL